MSRTIGAVFAGHVPVRNLIFPLVAWSVLTDSAAAQSSNADPICVDTEEVTWADLTIDPRGEVFLTSILGRIHSIPISGGQAEPLTHGSSWSTRPRYSRDGSQVAFVSDVDGGSRSLWVMDRSGKRLRKLDTGDRNVASFDWGPGDASLVVSYALEHRENDELQLIDLPSGSRRSLGPKSQRATDVRYSAFDNAIFYTVVGERDRSGIARSQIMQMSLASEEVNFVRLSENAFAPTPSVDGKLIAYARRIGNRTALWIADRATGSRWELIHSISPDQLADYPATYPQSLLPTFGFTNDGRGILIARHGRFIQVDLKTRVITPVSFWARVCRDIPRTHRQTITVGQTFTPKRIGWLDVAGDRRSAVLGAAGRIWRADLRTGAVLPFRTGEGRFYDPAVRADGSAVAYIRWTDLLGAELLVKRDGYPPSRVAVGAISDPRWSPDGKTLIFFRRRELICANKPPPEAAEACRRSYKAVLLQLVEWQAFRGGLRVLFRKWLPLFASQPGPPSFGESGLKIRFSMLEIEPGRPERLVLQSVDVRTLESSVTARFTDASTREIEGLYASPDGRHVAIGARDGVWIGKIRKADGKALSLSGDARIRRIGPIAGAAHWSDGGRLTWLSANRLFDWVPGLLTGKQRRQLKWQIERPTPTGVLAFRNVRLVTMKGEEVIEDGTIVVVGSRIVAVGPSPITPIPAGSTVVDGRGKTIIPGIVDTHAHAYRGASAGSYVFEQNLSFLASLAWGVTTILDPQADTSAIFQQAELVAAGEMIGPRVFSTGSGIFGKNTNKPTWAASRDELKLVVARRVEEGATMIKSYLIDRRDWRQAIVAAASARGIPVTTEGLDLAIAQLTHVADGHAAIEHNLAFYPLRRDVVDFIAKSGSFYTPVLVASTVAPTGASWFYGRGSHRTDPKYLRFSTLTKRLAGSDVQFHPDSLQPVFEAGASALKIARSGGKVTIGSHGEQHGLAAHWDMWLLAMSGFLPSEVLRAGTIAGAEKLGLQREIGSLETGKLADFLVLNGNPLDDIRNTARIHHVVQSGTVYDAETLTQIYPNYIPLKRPRQTTVEDWERYATPLPSPL